MNDRTTTHATRTSLKRSILIALGVFSAIVLLTLHSVFEIPTSQAQVPKPVTTSPITPPGTTPPGTTPPGTTASPVPTAVPSPTTTEGIPIDALPGSRTEPPKPPSPTASPTAAPAPLPPPLPSVIIPLDAKPLPIAGEHKDPAGRFQIGLLKGYRVAPLGDSILVEAPDGRLAYTVIAQSAAQLGFLSGVQLTPENLAQVVRNTLGRGEGFQAELPQSIENGIQLNWTGILTIGGKPQPVKGVVIAKPAPVSNSIVMLTIAATDPGASDLPGAIGSLSTTFQPL